MLSDLLEKCKFFAVVFLFFFPAILTTNSLFPPPSLTRFFFLQNVYFRYRFKFVTSGVTFKYELCALCSVALRSPGELCDRKHDIARNIYRESENVQQLQFLKSKEYENFPLLVICTDFAWSLSSLLVNISEYFFNSHIRNSRAAKLKQLKFLFFKIHVLEPAVWDFPSAALSVREGFLFRFFFFFHCLFIAV